MEIHAYPNPQYPLRETALGNFQKERSCFICQGMFVPSARCVWTIWKDDDHSNYMNLVGVVCDICALHPGERYPDLLRQHADNIERWIDSGQEFGDRAILLHKLAERMRVYATEQITVVPHQEHCPCAGI